MQHSAIVTGATSGLGLEITKKLLENNYRVFGISKTQNNWKNTLQFTNENKNLQLYKVNLTSPQSVSEFIRKIFKKDNKINLIINNAGYINTACKLEDTTIEEFNKNLRSNLYSVFFMCKFSIPYLLNNAPSTILNISSYAGKRAVPHIAVYSAAKSGVIALSQSIAKENKKNKLKCFSVCPGGINTPMRSKVFGDAALQQSPAFVAKIIIRAITGEIDVESGGDIVIRHGKVKINPSPAV